MHSDDVPNMAYAIGGRRWMKGSPGFAETIANAHTARQRPRCLCVPEGIEMYVARLAGPRGGYIVKRMPDTGYLHATDCPSYQPPAEFSGLGQVQGSAIIEDPATGEMILKLDFPLTKILGHSQIPPAVGESEIISSDGTKLSLRGLLHYLWDQAELTRWHPGFAGKRSWATVRRHLLQAAEHNFASGNALRTRLYVPEPFALDQRDAINGRRLAQWQPAVTVPRKPQQLMLLIGEVKEIVPSRYGYKVVVKHVPDQALALDEPLYRRLGRRFELELALWAANQDIHMITIATFGVGSTGVPAICNMCLMPVTRQWLPFTDGFERQLIDRLVSEDRAFVKGLLYNVSRRDEIASATLTDCEGRAPMLFIRQEGQYANGSPVTSRGTTWFWDTVNETVPALPPRREYSKRVK